MTPVIRWTTGPGNIPGCDAQPLLCTRISWGDTQTPSIPPPPETTSAGLAPMCGSSPTLPMQVAPELRLEKNWSAPLGLGDHGGRVRVWGGSGRQ